MRTRIKICGLTREQDVESAVQAGVDAVGFVFYPKSKRCLTPARAAQLRAMLPAFVDAVTLFVNADDAFVREVQQVVRPDLLQFHGTESPEFCERFSQRFLKAFAVGGPGLATAQAVMTACEPYRAAAGWIFDSHTPQFGGSGQSFDRGLLSAVASAAQVRPLVLSGGLTADSVRAQIETLHPWAVDVSSGVETEPGIKSDSKIRAFVDAVGLADHAQK